MTIFLLKRRAHDFLEKKLFVAIIDSKFVRLVRLVPLVLYEYYEVEKVILNHSNFFNRQTTQKPLN